VPPKLEAELLESIAETGRGETITAEELIAHAGPAPGFLGGERDPPSWLQLF
jgi:hypothetical protein